MHERYQASGSTIQLFYLVTIGSPERNAVSDPVRPTFQAIVDQSLRVTGASTGWLLAVDDDGLQVVAVGGLAADADTVGRVLKPSGARGFALSSGQPAALMPPPTDAANDGAGGFPGVPSSVLAVPCGRDVAVGVLELADKANAMPFTFADIEALAGLASVAGAALAEEDVHVDVRSPAELGAELTRLASRDPGRYTETAKLIDALLGP